MINYAEMICRECGTRIIPREATVAASRQANSYADCNYVCPNPNCRTAYSNAQTEAARRRILPTSELNVPAEVRDGVDATIDRALNVGNRESKRAKFAFESSEDAVTWTVFRYIQIANAMCAVLRLDDEVEDVLFWGVSYPNNENAVRANLEKILGDVLGEDSRRFTEPDVIILLKASVVFIEVKYGSPNDCQPGYPHFERYLGSRGDLFIHTLEEVKTAGFYELTRNWIVGSLLAQALGRKFLLVNLAPEVCRPSAARFEATLATNEAGDFRFDAWREFLARIPQPWPSWFDKYVAARQLRGGKA